MLWDVRVARDGSDPRHVVVASDCPADISEHPEKHSEHENESKLGLVNSTVTLGHPDDRPVAERSGDEHGQDNADKGTQVGQTLCHHENH